MANPKQKTLGQVFTPISMVQFMLDQINYRGTSILKKHVIDNSCGEGAFLIEVVKRYIEVAQETSLTPSEIAHQLENYIHGIEIDSMTHQRCLSHLNQLLHQADLPLVNWDIQCTNALSCSDYHQQMDYVIGNPPYIRIHELYQQNISLENFTFCQKGMVDSYLAFYELGLRMLNPQGILIYIAPKSWLQSKAGEVMRQRIKEEQLLTHLIDLGHFQPFKATTYPNIVCLSRGHQQPFFKFSRFDEHTFQTKATETLSYEVVEIQGKFYLGCPTFLPIFKDILSTSFETPDVVVKNGMTTNCDEVFFHPEVPEAYTIPMLKASKGKWHRTFFPYDEAGNPLPLDELMKDEALKTFLLTHQARLSRRDLANPEEWYLFGRTQGLKDVNRPRYAINTIVKSPETLRLMLVRPGEGVYAGLYLLTERTEEELRQAFKHPYFTLFLETIGRYRSGGYYTYSSKEMSQYLNYYFAYLMA